jgi:hypothetical protein
MSMEMKGRLRTRLGRWAGPALAAIALATAGCEGGGPPVAAQVSTAGAQVDTVFPVEDALRRFRADVPDAPAGLRGGEPSVEALVDRWVDAVESHDTATVRRLVLDRSEFAYLYYPTSPFSREPYYQPPELVWFQFQANSEKGIMRVLRRLGGSELRYVGVECPEPPTTQGGNRIRERCVVLRLAGADTVSQGLFGGIIERDARFKFITYANQM